MKYEQCRMELQKRFFCSSFVFPCIPFNIIMIRRTKRSAKFDCGKPYFPCSLLFLQATENQWAFYIWGISEAPKIPSSLQIWINEFVYCAMWISVFQNNDGFQCISSNSSFHQSLYVFFPHFLRATHNISDTSSSHTTSWLKGGLQHILKCHPVLHRSISGWNTGIFFILSHFPCSVFLILKFGTTAPATYHWPPHAFLWLLAEPYMFWGDILHFFFFFFLRTVTMNWYFLLSWVAKFLASCTI